MLAEPLAGNDPEGAAPFVVVVTRDLVSPYDAVRAMWFDSLTYAPTALRALLDLVGHDRVVIGSDAPFFAPAPGYTVDELHELEPLDAAVLEAIRTTNAVEFLGLPHAPRGAA